MTREFESVSEEFTWQPYRVRPLAVWAMRMNRDFDCPTLQGTLRGKSGDWAVRADDGSTFPVADEIFRRYYVKREWRPHESKNKEVSDERDAAPNGVSQVAPANDERTSPR